MASFDQQRLQRALEANFAVTAKTALFSVDGTAGAKYTVTVLDEKVVSCSCPDYEYRMSKTNGSCKHMIAIAMNCGKLKTACPYGMDCYRKNLSHFQQCIHPDGFKIPEDAFPDEKAPEEVLQEASGIPHAVPCPVDTVASAVSIPTGVRRSTRAHKVPDRYDPSNY